MPPPTLPQVVKHVCKLGEGPACCRYLVVGAGGFTCAKVTALRGQIDARVASGVFVSAGDNCPGRHGPAAEWVLTTSEGGDA